MSAESELRRDLSEVLAPFPREQQYLLPALQAVQAELGSLPAWALLVVGEHLRVPSNVLYGVATHFPELRLGGPAAHTVRVCTGLSCQVLGSGNVLGALQQRLGARAGERAGAVQLEETACAFICGVAPVVEIDGVTYGGLTPERAVTLVEEQTGR